MVGNSGKSDFLNCENPLFEPPSEKRSSQPGQCVPQLDSPVLAAPDSLSDMANFWRFLRLLAVTVWFGIWVCGLSYLLLSGTVVDSRDVGPAWMSQFGCVLLIIGWLGLSICFAFHDDFPDSW